MRDVLELDVKDPNSVEIVNSELVPSHHKEKLSHLDLRVKTTNNEYINVEIQMKNEYNMIPRSIYYNSKLLSSQPLQTGKYEELG